MSLHQAVKSLEKDNQTLQEEHLVRLNKVLLESAPNDAISQYVDENVESPASRMHVSPRQAMKPSLELKSNKIKQA